MDRRALLERIDLKALAEEAGARFNASHSSRCPLHAGSDNPAAFHIFQGKDDGLWRWHCFTRCPEGENSGDAIAFYMRWRGVDFRTAVRELEERAGMPPDSQPRPRPAPPSLPPTLRAPTGEPPNAQWQKRAREFVAFAHGQLWAAQGQGVLSYLHRERGYTDDTIRHWSLGYNPRDEWDDLVRWGIDGADKTRKLWCPRGVVFPTLRDGTVRAVSVRRPLPGDALARVIGAVGRQPKDKYWSLRGGQRGLFGVDRLRGLPVLIMAEGEADAILAWQAVGDLADVTTLGGARRRLNALDAAFLARAWVILAIYDEDAAGAEGLAYLRKVSRRVTVVRPLAHDLTDYWCAGGDLRQWLAGLVLEQVDHLLADLDARRHPDLFARWSEVRRRAAESLGVPGSKQPGKQFRREESHNETPLQRQTGDHPA